MVVEHSLAKTLPTSIADLVLLPCHWHCGSQSISPQLLMATLAGIPTLRKAFRRLSGWWCCFHRWRRSTCLHVVWQESIE